MAKLTYSGFQSWGGYIDILIDEPGRSQMKGTFHHDEDSDRLRMVMVSCRYVSGRSMYRDKWPAIEERDVLQAVSAEGWVLYAERLQRNADELRDRAEYGLDNREDASTDDERDDWDQYYKSHIAYARQRDSWADDAVALSGGVSPEAATFIVAGELTIPEAILAARLV